MKLPRYISGKSNIALLSQPQTLSPGEVASEALAKGSVITAALTGGAKVLLARQEFNDRMELAEDRTEMNAIETAAKVTYKQFDTDPRWDLPQQEDGTPTAEAMTKQAADNRLKILEMASNIKDPVRREQFNRSLVGMLDFLDVSALQSINEKRIEISNNKAFDTIEIASQNGDFESARNQLQDLVDMGHIDEGVKDKNIALIDKREEIFLANEIVNQIDKAYAISEEAGDAAYRELLKDEPSAVRNRAIDGAEEKKSEWHKARTQEREQLEAQAIRNYGEDYRRADAGGMSFKEIDASQSSGRIGKGKISESRRNELYAAAIRAAKRKDAEIDIRETLENGDQIIKDKPHRDAFDTYLDSVTEGKTAEEERKIIGDLSKTAGTASTMTSHKLNTAGGSNVAAVNQIDLYLELTSDENRMPDLNLKPKAAYQLEHMKNLMIGGVTKVEAAEFARDANPDNMDDATLASRKLVDTADEGFNALDDLLETVQYDRPRWGTDFEPGQIPDEMFFEYQGLFDEVYMATGDLETAESLANRGITSNWEMTNINGEGYKLQKFGIAGDSSSVRKSILRELQSEGSDFYVKDESGDWQSTDIIDEEDIKFKTFRNESEAYNKRGDQRFKVEYKGMLLSRKEIIEDDEGNEKEVIKVATAVVDGSKLAVFKQKSANIEAAEKRIEEIKKEETRLNNQMNIRVLRTAVPGMTKKHKERLKILSFEREARGKELLTVDVKFDAN